MEINAIDVTLSGKVKANDIAWLDSGEDVVSAIKGITSDGKKIIGFTFDGTRFGVLVQ